MRENEKGEIMREKEREGRRLRVYVEKDAMGEELETTRVKGRRK